VTRRRVRAFNRLRAGSANLPFAYRFWIRTIERNPQRAAEFDAIVGGWSWHPRFAVLLYDKTTSTKEQMERSVSSVERQFYIEWTLIESLAQFLAADFEYLVPLRAGDELSEAALFRLAETLQSNPGAAVLYGDQDELDRRGRRNRPWFKPRWNPEMFLAQDFLSAAIAIRKTEDLRTLAGDGDLAAGDLDGLLLALTSTTKDPVVHVPHILCHVGSRPGEPGRSRASVVASHLQKLGATTLAGPFGTAKVQWPLPVERPLVSIIIPTRDRVDLLRACVESVRSLTSYSPIEIIIVDNGSTDNATIAYLAQLESSPAIRILRYDQAYNYSAINNFAASFASGSYLCLLNNDTEVIEPEWLTEMMRYAARPDIGAVGAKLLYSDGTIQHAGVIIGLGEGAGHAHRFQPAGEEGYFRQAHVAQFVSAVTAACLVLEKKKYEEVGGLDAQNLAIAYNDVDLCLKLQAAGWRNVYVPHAVLLHHESKSRGSDVSPEHIERYTRELLVLQERWGTATYEDPLHNPNLDRYSETFVIRI
jgi:O-antigen biosynthesis protein